MAKRRETCDRLAGLTLTARSCGWWWPFTNAAVMTERPIALHLDEQGSLHNTAGMAIEYGDGWGIYAWHGVRIPHRIITAPETLTPEVILSEDNAEIRRIMIERVGLERFLSEAKPRVLDTAVQPMRPGEPDQINELVSIDLPGDPDGVLVAVKVIDPSTGRLYFLRVPPNMQRVQQALAWTFDLNEHEYLLSQQS